MNTNTAYLSHDQHDPARERSLREWADITGRKPDSLMKTVRRKLGPGHSLDSLLSADQFEAMFHKTAVIVRPKHTDKPTRTTDTQRPTHKSQPTKTNQSTANPFTAYRRPILYALMAMPAIASVQNMYSVTADIAAHTFTAALLTGLFSATPFLFVLAGMRNRWTQALAACMIAYECFANVTRIYGGLTGFGKGDFPTRFLGLVCDFFNTGTYPTARTLALLMAAMAAAVFYAAYHELNRTR